MLCCGLVPAGGSDKVPGLLGPHHRNGGLIRLMEPGSEWVRIIAVLFSAGHKVSVWGAV